jgi:hypothetical protein
MHALPDPKPDLGDASDTDEIYDLAYRLAGWGLRKGECDEHSAVDWVLDHPHEAKLPRGSHARLNPTRHHIRKGAERAAEQYVPGLRGTAFDPEPLHALAARVSGSGVTHERYLLGAVALCFKYETLTPVITGPLLAQVVGVHEQAAYKVLREWSDTLARGFFTAISYDGERGHGRTWTVDPGWIPASKPKHEPGCNRAKSRCQCPRLSQNGIPIFTAEKDSYTKVRQFVEWVATLKPRTALTVTSVARELGITRAAATKLLRTHQGTILDEGTFQGRIRQRDNDGRAQWVSSERWFVADAT